MEALNKKVIEKSLPKVDLLSFYYCKLIKTKKNILKRPPYLKKSQKHTKASSNHIYLKNNPCLK